MPLPPGSFCGGGWPPPPAASCTSSAARRGCCPGLTRCRRPRISPPHASLDVVPASLISLVINPSSQHFPHTVSFQNRMTITFKSGSRLRQHLSHTSYPPLHFTDIRPYFSTLCGMSRGALFCFLMSSTPAVDLIARRSACILGAQEILTSRTPNTGLMLSFINATCRLNIFHIHFQSKLSVVWHIQSFQSTALKARVSFPHGKLLLMIFQITRTFGQGYHIFLAFNLSLPYSKCIHGLHPAFRL